MSAVTRGLSVADVADEFIAKVAEAIPAKKTWLIGGGYLELRLRTKTYRFTPANRAVRRRIGAGSYVLPVAASDLIPEMERRGWTRR